MRCLCGPVVRGQEAGDDGRTGECHGRGDDQADAERVGVAVRGRVMECGARAVGEALGDGDGGADGVGGCRCLVCRESVGRILDARRVQGADERADHRDAQGARDLACNVVHPRRDAGRLLGHGTRDEESVAGPMIQPIDSARPKNHSPRGQYAISGVQARLVANSAARPTRPVVTTRVVPSRATSLMLDPAPMTSPKASGTIAAPACSAL